MEISEIVRAAIKLNAGGLGKHACRKTDATRSEAERRKVAIRDAISDYYATEAGVYRGDYVRARAITISCRR